MTLPPERDEAQPATRAMFDTSTLDKAVRERQQRLAAEQAELLDRVRRTLQELRKPLGIESAYIVGSLRSPDFWKESSDVDVAVAGCSPIVLEVMKALEEATGRAVDVIDLDQHPSFQSFVRSGLRLYE